MRKSTTITKQLTTLSLVALVLLGLIVVPRLASAQDESDTEDVLPSQTLSTNLAPPANDNFANATLLLGASGATQNTNVDATKESGEPNHAGNTGGRSVWYKWTYSLSYTAGLTFTLRHNLTNFDSTLAVYTGSSVNALTTIASNDDFGSTPSLGTSTVYYAATPGTTYYIAVDGYNGSSGFFQLSFDFNRTHGRSSKFTGTGQSAVSVFRPSNGNWYTNSSSGFQAVQFGQSGDIPAPADFDGDNVTDYAVFRPGSGTWYALLSGSNTLLAARFGQNGDKPVPGDFAAKGYASFCVFRPSNGTWYINGNSGVVARQFGQAGDKPVPRDFDMDGKLDLTVFRPSNGTWYILNSNDNSFKYQQWGTSEDIPVPSGYSSTGRADIAVWRPSNGTWYVYLSYNNQFLSKSFGLIGDIPQPIDFGTNTGRADFGVYRSSNRTWYILDGSTDEFWAVPFGSNGDIPASTAYVVGQ